MNMSELLTRAKISLGLYGLALPFENPDQMMTEIVQNVTLPTFSTYCPFITEMRFDVTNFERIEKNGNYESYLLPDIFNERKLMQVLEVRYDESDISGIGYWGGGVPIFHGNMINQALLSNAGLNLTQKVIPRLTFKFEHPRKITLYNNLSSAKMVFKFALEHDKNLVSISPTMEESFRELALLDIKDALYQVMKHYSNINTVYGNIDMKLDEWQQASADRKQLLDEWDNTYHIDMIPIDFF